MGFRQFGGVRNLGGLEILLRGGGTWMVSE